MVIYLVSPWNNARAGLWLTPRLQAYVNSVTHTPESPQLILKVAVSVPLSRAFDYLPRAGSPIPEPGCRVQIPFGTRQRVGVVVGHLPLLRPGALTDPVALDIHAVVLGGAVVGVRRGASGQSGYGSGYGAGDGWGRGYNYSAPYWAAPYGYAPMAPVAPAAPQAPVAE